VHGVCVCSGLLEVVLGKRERVPIVLSENELQAVFRLVLHSQAGVIAARENPPTVGNEAAKRALELAIAETIDDCRVLNKLLKRAVRVTK